MEGLLLAFITGLTTGGLSCLAVQGGLLASSLANQIEKDLLVTTLPLKGKKKRPQLADSSHKGSHTALPILLFLAAKLLAYTTLGLLLGLAGSFFQLSPLARAVLQFAIGIFMIGSALRMLNVHPIFRYFAFEPPAFLRRRIRKTASTNVSYTTPVFLGLLTVLIPCGITQAMMAVALSTGSPATGAALMFAFTLGTSPVFFAVAYFATRLGAKLEKGFMRFVAVVVLLLGLVAIDTGLNLAGSPVSVTRLVNARTSQTAAAETERSGLNLFSFPELDSFNVGSSVEDPLIHEDENVITINVLNTAYDPSLVKAKAGVDLKLKLVSKGTYSCSLAFVIPRLNVAVNLKPTDVAYIDIPAQAAGTRIPFACSMGMFTGDIIFE